MDRDWLTDLFNVCIQRGLSFGVVNVEERVGGVQVAALLYTFSKTLLANGKSVMHTMACASRAACRWPSAWRANPMRL